MYGVLNHARSKNFAMSSRQHLSVTSCINFFGPQIRNFVYIFNKYCGAERFRYVGVFSHYVANELLIYQENVKSRLYQP